MVQAGALALDRQLEGMGVLPPQMGLEILACSALQGFHCAGCRGPHLLVNKQRPYRDRQRTDRIVSCLGRLRTALLRKLPQCGRLVIFAVKLTVLHST